MKLNIDYTLTRREIITLDSVLDSTIKSFTIDIESIDNSLTTLVLLEWYKRNLSAFKFPEEENELHFSSSESLAFFNHFKHIKLSGFEGHVVGLICQDIITILTGGSINKPKKYEAPDDKNYIE